MGGFAKVAATVPDMFVHNNSIGFAGWTDPLSFICSLSATAYSFGGLGETCPTGTEIITVEECQMAIQALGILQAPKDTWTGTVNHIPTHCSFNGLGPFFNHASTGSGRSDMSPICRSSGYFGAGQGEQSCPVGSAITSNEDCFTASALCVCRSLLLLQRTRERWSV